MWHNSSKEDLFNSLPTPETSGWKFDDGSYTIDWECLEIQKKILKKRSTFLLRAANAKWGAKQTNVAAKRKETIVGLDVVVKAAITYRLQKHQQ